MAKKPTPMQAFNDMRQSIARVSNTEDGQVLLRWLYAQTGYNQASIVTKTDTEISTLGTIYNEARRNIWVELKALLPVAAQMKIEYPNGDNNDAA